ncbi:MAG: hypothetical protein ACKOHG_15725, partial [Planctomycetia bacterium]
MEKSTVVAAACPWLRDGGKYAGGPCGRQLAGRMGRWYIAGLAPRTRAEEAPQKKPPGEHASMPLDPYSPCPGGTGKKIKFCCSELVG